MAWGGQAQEGHRASLVGPGSRRLRDLSTEKGQNSSRNRACAVSARGSPRVACHPAGSPAGHPLHLSAHGGLGGTRKPAFLTAPGDAGDCCPGLAHGTNLDLIHVGTGLGDSRTWPGRGWPLGGLLEGTGARGGCGPGQGRVGHVLPQTLSSRFPALTSVRRHQPREARPVRPVP